MQKNPKPKQDERCSIAEPLLGSFLKEHGMLLTTVGPKIFIDGFCLCMEKRQNTISLVFSLFTILRQFFMVIFTVYTPSGFSNRLGIKFTSRQENAIAKSTITVVRVAEVVGLGPNSTSK